MELLPIGSLKKFTIKMDGNTVAEFYHTKDMDLRERDSLAREYAQYNFISQAGVKVYPVTNDRKLNGVSVIPHYGRIG